MTTKLLALSPLTDANITTLEKYHVTVVTPENITPDDYSDIVISYGWRSKIINKILETPNNQLKWIQSFSAGVDFMPLDELKKHQIILTNTSGQKAVPIAQSVMSYIFYFARGLHVYQTQNYWEPFEQQFTLQELPVVIFGAGRIGQQIAAYLHTFGSTVYGVNTTGHPVGSFENVFAIDNLQEIPKDIAIVINALPGTTDTENFFNKEHLDLFKNLFLFVNIGRGSTVNEQDLLNKLNDGSIQHAALDVTKQEPIPKDSKLWHQDNLLLTQHSTWAGESESLFHVFMKNLPDFLTDKPLTYNVVDYERGY